MFYKKKDRHFRGHKTRIRGKLIVHPSYISGEEDDSFYHLGFTHSPKKGKHHPNHRLLKNPKKGDESVVYIHKKIELDKKSHFTPCNWENYQMGKEDDCYVDYLLKKKKNRQ